MVNTTRASWRSGCLGVLSAGVFVITVAVTLIPAIAVVRDDSAWVTYGVIGVCLTLGWLASRGVQRAGQRWIDRRG